MALGNNDPNLRTRKVTASICQFTAFDCPGDRPGGVAVSGSRRADAVTLPQRCLMSSRAATSSACGPAGAHEIDVTESDHAIASGQLHGRPVADRDPAKQALWHNTIIVAPREHTALRRVSGDQTAASTRRTSDHDPYE